MQWKSGDTGIFLATVLVFDLWRRAVVGLSPLQRCHGELGGILSLHSFTLVLIFHFVFASLTGFLLNQSGFLERFT